MISSLGKVTGIQTGLLLEKSAGLIFVETKNKVLGIKNIIKMTAVMILVIPPIIFKYRSLQLMLVGKEGVFYG